MDHKLCRENLSAYLDNELPREEKAALESHLAACAECRKELDELRSLSSLIREHAAERAPISLKEKVFAEPEGRPAFYAWLKPALAASMAAAGVLLVLNVVKNPESSQAPTAFMSRSVSNMAAASRLEEAPLPPLPGKKLSEPEAGIASGSSLDMFDAGAADSDKSDTMAQKPRSFTGAGGGALAITANSRYSAGRKAGALSLDKAAPTPAEQAALDTKKGAFGQAKYAPRPKQETAFPEGELITQESALAARPEAEHKAKGTTFAPASVAAVRGSADRSSLLAKRAAVADKRKTDIVPVRDYILENYIAGDGKAANRFKETTFRTVPSGDAGKDTWESDKYGTVIFYRSGRSFEYFDSKGKKLAGPWTGDYAMQLWDVFIYTGKAYLLFNMEHNGKYTFKYYLIEAERLDHKGAIEYWGSNY